MHQVLLLHMGIPIVVCSPSFLPVDRKNNRDWRPIGAAMARQNFCIQIGKKIVPSLIRKPYNIAVYLHWLAHVEIDRRFQLAEDNIPFDPLYSFIDEWPLIVHRCNQLRKDGLLNCDVAADLASVLMRGRTVDVCVDTSSQGFLVRDTELLQRFAQR